MAETATQQPKYVRMLESDFNRYKSLMKQMEAQGERNAQNVGVPGFLYKNREDREFQIERGRHVAKWLAAVGTKNYSAYDRLVSDNKEWYSQKAAFNEGTNAEGLYLVPDVWDQDIYRVRDDWGYARRMFRMRPLASKNLHLHTGKAVTASFYTEGVPATLQDAATFFSRNTVTAKWLRAALWWTLDVEEDAIPAMIDYLTTEIGIAIAAEEDRVAFNGDVSGNSDAFNGVLNISGTNTVYQGQAAGSGKTSFANVSWEDLVWLSSEVKTAGLRNAAFVTCRTVYNYLRVQKDDSKRPIWMNEMPGDIAGTVGLESLAGSVRWTPLGYPMVVVPDDAWPADAANTPSVAFGDFNSYALFGERKGLIAQTFDQYYGGQQLSSTHRVLEFGERIAFGFPEPAAFGVLKTAGS